MIKAIIFDLDGTLLDTSRDIQSVLNSSLNKFNLPALSLEDTKKFVGNGAKKLIERAVGNRTDLLEEVYADYSVNFANCKNELSVLYEGEDCALEAFKAKGIKLAIVTNKPQKATEGVYNKHLKKFGFCFVSGQTESIPLKPDPFLTLKIIDELKLEKSEVLFVGDGETDVITAANAGVKCVSVLWGFRTKEELNAAGATLFAENYAQLEKIVFSS